MSEFKIYTEEQEQKIARLREEASKPKEKVVNHVYVDWNREIKTTDRVFVQVEGNTIVGYVLDKTKTGYKISTPYGIMKDVSEQNLRLRNYQDLSHVVIPDALKKISTKTLLSELSSRRFNTGYDDDYYGDYYRSYKSPMDNFSEDEIRAELRTRPNIRSKKGSKIVKKFSK